MIESFSSVIKGVLKEKTAVGRRKLSFNLYKVVIAGEGGVGKTTLTQRFLTGEFIGDTLMTLGVAFYVHKVKIEDEEITLQIWDLGGQEQFRSMGVFDRYIKGAKGAIFAFDLTRMRTLLSLSEWQELVSKNVDNIPVVLVGTKSDLENEIQVTENMITEKKEELKVKNYFETSSLTGKNVENVFNEIAYEIRRENIKTS